MAAYASRRRPISGVHRINRDDVPLREPAYVPLPPIVPPDQARICARVDAEMRERAEGESDRSLRTNAVIALLALAALWFAALVCFWGQP